MGEMDLEALKDVLYDREVARAQKDYGRSDQIREELRGVGVELDDKTHEWRTEDGQTGSFDDIVKRVMEDRKNAGDAGPKRFVKEDNRFRGSGRAFVGAKTGARNAWANDPVYSAIQAQIDEREVARRAKNWEVADSIRDKLREEGVQCMDTENMWKGPNHMMGTYYFGELNEVGLQMIFKYREQMRAAKDYANADNLRHLLRDCGVEVRDKDGVWNTRDGRSGSLSQFGIVTPRDQFNGGRMGMDMGMGMGMPMEPMPSMGMMGGRSGMRDMGMRDMGMRDMGMRDMGMRDMGMRDMGMRDMGMRDMGMSRSRDMGMRDMGDVRGMRNGDMHYDRRYGRSRSRSPRRMMNNPSDSLDGMVHIDTFLIKRDMVRKNRNFELADKIRDVLGEVGIFLSDKERRWTFPNGTSGPYPDTRDMRM